MTKRRLILVDGSYYLFRAYHALPALSNHHDEPTGAIYGVGNMIRSLLDQYEPDYFAVIFDAKGKTFRSDLYPEYKANRPPIAADLAQQIAPLHELIQAMGIPLLCIHGVEADDVIGTLAKQANTARMKVLISTGDKDLAQLVNDDISLLNTMSGVLMDPSGVREKFGVPPERMVDYLSLIGDSVDNIPGVPKVGPKTAVNWLEAHHSLDGLIQQADTIKGKVGENLRGNLEQLHLSRTLVTLKTDVELDRVPQDLQITAPDVSALKRIYAHWGFKQWLQALEGEADPADSGKQRDPRPSTYDTLLDEQALDKWLAELKKAPLLSIDTETDSLDYMQAKLIGISFAIGPDKAAYLPLGHDYPGAPRQIRLTTALKKLRPLLEDPKLPKVGQNLKYDAHIFANYGISLAGITHDTMLESYVINSAANRHNMDALARRWLDHETIHYEDLTGKGKKQIPFGQVQLGQASHYAAEDADIALKLHRTLYPRIQEHPELDSLYRTIEIPLLSVLMRMERHGVIINTTLLQQQSQQITARMATIEHEAHQLAGEEFNLDSTKQTQTILYEKMGLPILQKTPKGQPSTAESVLQDLAYEHQLPDLILQHRGLSKLRSTYTNKLPLLINAETGRIHTSYHQAVAITGRLSSSDPNLQNIPIKSPEGRKIRRAFTCPQGYYLLSADYSQIELRIMAHFSKDENLLSAFTNGEDVHSKTAAELFAVPLVLVDPDQRRIAKAINFGLFYGMSAFGLAKQLKIRRKQAQEYIDLYFQRYSGVKRYMHTLQEEAKRLGYVKTAYQRRLYLPDINARNTARRQYAERTAINAPMQGTVADLIKVAMIRIDRFLADSPLDARMIMQVHDELVFEVGEKDLEPASKKIAELMTQAMPLDVPLKVSLAHGEDWDQAH